MARKDNDPEKKPFVRRVYILLKYKNRFSLVLVIIYGSLLALSVIGIIVLFCFFIGMF